MTFATNSTIIAESIKTTLLRSRSGRAVIGIARIFKRFIAPHSRDFNEMLHALRTRELHGMPQATTLLSAGCSGAWYFDWIAENYGQPQRHIGLEFYSPKPDSLPANVEWIANTVGDMRDVASGSVDLVFSGQNIEHLWPQDIEGFLREANRVLRDEGALVIDSPNRSITTPQRWAHPEHIIELTVAEIKGLLHLSGFDVTAVRGLWLSRDPKTGQQLRIDNLKSYGRWAAKRRIALGRGDPENSFVWWAEARKSNRSADVPALRNTIQRICSIAWPERLGRVSSNLSPPVIEDGREFVNAASGQSGALIFGPYAPLKAARYLVSFAIAAETKEMPSNEVVAICEVRAGSTYFVERRVHASDLPPYGNGVIEIAFALDRLHFGVECRLIATGRTALKAAFSIGLSENGQVVLPAPAPLGQMHR